MKRLVVKSLLLIILPIIVVNVIILLMKDDYSLQSNEINAALSYERLDSLRNDKKIVIIAGSNGSWGINSQMLADSFHLPVVNTSTHAGIGIRMQFEMYKHFLKKDDIVLFCPEYYSGTNSLYGESTLLRIVSTLLPHEYLHFSLRQWIHTYKYIGIHLQECIQHRGTKNMEGPFSAKAVNQFGDIGALRSYEDFDLSYVFKGKLDTETIDYLKYVFSYSEERGIKFIYLPPALMQRNYLDQEKQIDSLAADMRNNGVPYFTETKRYMFPDSLFNNTPYHMTTEGAAIRTHRLVEDIKLYLENK